MPLAGCRECGKEVSTEAKTCPHCGVQGPVKRRGGCGCLGIGGLLLLVLAIVYVNLPTSRKTEPRQLTEEHRRAITTALQEKGLPAPESIEISGGYLVVTIELKGNMSEGVPRRTGEGAVITIRNAMLGSGLVDSYRVTVNGPSPGPGLIRRYGSARFLEDYKVTWEQEQ